MQQTRAVAIIKDFRKKAKKVSFISERWRRKLFIAYSSLAGLSGEEIYKLLD